MIPLFVAALFVSLAVSSAIFGALMTASTAYVACLTALLLASYRNCERLPNRRIFSRMLIRLRSGRTRRARRVEQELTKVKAEDRSLLQEIRLSHAAQMASSLSDPGFRFSRGWPELDNQISSYLTDNRADREWKTLRDLPFEKLDRWSLYSVRLIHADGPELPGFAACLSASKSFASEQRP